jgi:hypothetical protein
VTEAQLRIRFITIVCAVWAVVVMSALYKFIWFEGPLPDPILLGIPTTVWLAVYPPLPRALREEEASVSS